MDSQIGRGSRGPSVVAAIAAVLVLVSFAAQAQLLPVGPPLILSDSPTGVGCPALAARPEGNFVVAWPVVVDGRVKLSVRGGSSAGVLATPTDVQTPVEGISTIQLIPTREGFTVLWLSRLGSAGSYHGLSLDRVGLPHGDVVSLHRGALLLSPRAVGGFASVSLTSRGGKKTIVTQLLDNGGDPIGAPRKLVVPGAQSPSLVQGEDGGALLLWEGLKGGSDDGLHAIRVGADGLLRGRPFALLPTTPWQTEVALGADGTIAVAANDYSGVVLVRTYDASGRALASAPTELVEDAWFIEGLAVNSSGHVLVSWENDYYYSPPVARAIELSRRGVPLSSSVVSVTNPSRPGPVHSICAAVVSAGDSWLVAYRSSDHGIVLQRYSSAP